MSKTITPTSPTPPIQLNVQVPENGDPMDAGQLELMAQRMVNNDAALESDFLEMESILSDVRAKTDGAISTPTPNRLIQRDANGRAQVASPNAPGDITTKGFEDTRVFTKTTIATADTTINVAAGSGQTVIVPQGVWLFFPGLLNLSFAGVIEFNRSGTWTAIGRISPTEPTSALCLIVSDGANVRIRNTTSAASSIPLRRVSIPAT